MSLGLEPSAYGTHSMRCTKVAPIYRKTDNLRAVHLLLGHTKMDRAVRYLVVDIEEALSLSEAIDPVAIRPAGDFRAGRPKAAGQARPGRSRTNIPACDRTQALFIPVFNFTHHLLHQ